VSRTPEDSARRQANRVMVLERRMRQLAGQYHKTNTQIAEISALEWAIPILEQYMSDTFGDELSRRVKWHKHEKLQIKSDLWDRDSQVCYLCQENMSYREATIDHVIPLAKGGADNPSNYKLTHPKCNLEKGNMLLEVYLKWREKHYEQNNLA
jgi:5-methylcytosine-specific restriction protein A